MYPLNMNNPVAGGFAVANDEAEHRALTALGYAPAIVEAEKQYSEPESDTVKRGPGRPKKTQ